MNSFINKHKDHVSGVLSGFDRLVLRGSLRNLAYVAGLRGYLNATGVLLKDFSKYALQITAKLKEASLEKAKRLDRPIKYLSSSQIRKEDVARKIAQEDKIDNGLICVLTCVEPCMSYEIYRNAETKLLELQPRQRKCLHLYHYFMHPVFGFMHARVQTWLPCSIQVCLNGREWLSRQMDKAGIDYRRRDNSFSWIADFDAAQKLFDQQRRASWTSLLDKVARTIHPAHGELFRTEPDGIPLGYYWSTHQSEWATDVAFTSLDTLQAVYPRLVNHSIMTHGIRDVMRFLGKKLNQNGNLPRSFNGEIVSDAKLRPEGLRVKHWLNGNSVKMYDKGNNLRFETTIDNPDQFKVFRAKEGDPDGQKSWLPMRKGIADLHRRAEVSQSANDRFMEAQAAVTNDTPLRELTDQLCRRVRRAGRVKPNGERAKARHFRALRPFSPDDAELLTAVSRPEFTQNGIRNRDLCALLYTAHARTKQEQRRRSSAVTRKLALLRAHGLIKKVPKSHRYTVTSKGRIAITALLAARNATTDQLTKEAA